MTQGYLGIALYGVNGGYRTKDALGETCTPYLIPDLLPFIQPGRPVYLAFDQDAAVETNQSVERGGLVLLLRRLQTSRTSAGGAKSATSTMETLAPPALTLISTV